MGSDPLLVQGAGGNISLKENDTLWVKGSGQWLSQAIEKNIFLSLPLSSVRKKIHAGLDFFSASNTIDETALHPSIETPIHALLPQKIVLHLHMIDALVYSIVPNAQAQLEEKLYGLNWNMLPYVQPGLSLSTHLSNILTTSANTNVFILQNHGIIIGADTYREVILLLNDLIQRLSLPVQPIHYPNLFELNNQNDVGWKIPFTPLLHFLAVTSTGLNVCRSNPLYPDQVIFLGPAIAEGHEEECASSIIARFEKTYTMRPKFLIIPNKGILLAPDITKGAVAILEGLANIAIRLPYETKLHGLTQEDVAVLHGWDAETRRQTLDKTFS